jgi:hypothetical protein
MQCVRVYTQVVRDAVGESHRPVADNVCHATRDKHSATSSPEREGTVRREPRLPDLLVSLNASDVRLARRLKDCAVFNASRPTPRALSDACNRPCH